MGRLVARAVARAFRPGSTRAAASEGHGARFRDLPPTAFAAEAASCRPQDRCRGYPTAPDGTHADPRRALFPCARGSGRERALAQQALEAHDMQDEDLVPVVAVEDAAGRLDHLAITRSPELSRPTATLGKFSQPFGVIEDALDEICRCNRVQRRNEATRAAWAIGECAARGLNMQSVAWPLRGPARLYCADSHADHGGPEGEERQQARTDRIWIRIRPESDARENDDCQQRAATKCEQPKADPEKAAPGVPAH